MADMLRALLFFLAIAPAALAQPGPGPGPQPVPVPYAQGQSNMAISIPRYPVNAASSWNLYNVIMGDGAMGGGGTSRGNVAIGFDAFLDANGSSPSGYNVAIGYQAEKNDTGGLYNSCIGSNACQWVEGGTGPVGGNVAVGHGAMGGDDAAPVANTAADNVAVGAWSGQEITTNNASVYVGMSAGLEVSGGADDVGIGFYALSGCPTAGTGCFDNIPGITSPSHDTCMGWGACWTMSTSDNTAIGFRAVESLTTGSLMTAVGRDALQDETTGVRDTCMGYLSCNVEVGASDNTAFGAQTGKAMTSGNNNTLLGSAAGDAITTGAFDIIIGSQVQAAAAGQSHEINIGNFFFGQAESTATAPVVSACGTESIDAHANNGTGTVDITAGTPSSCTITFANSGFTTWNHCNVSWQTPNTTVGYSYSLTAITITGTSLAGNFDYACQGI